MAEVFTIEAFAVTLLASGVRLATPLMLAAIGELVAERSGVLNMSLEGIMLTAAFSAYATSFIGGSGLAIASGVLVGALFGLGMAYLSVTLKLNQVIGGLSLWLLGVGLSAFLFRATFGIKSVLPAIEVLPEIRIPILGDIPAIGEILFNQNILTYAMYILVPLAAVTLYRTSLGLKIMSVGENPRAADALGINVYKMRYLTVVVGAILAGVAGAFLPLQVGFFRENMSQGRGFIAIAIVVFGNWHVYRAFAGALIFGAADAIQFGLQVLGQLGSVGLYNVLQMIPYLVTIVVLIVATRRANVPEALAEPYERG
jgi:simple sugar transport system permease protein